MPIYTTYAGGRFKKRIKQSRKVRIIEPSLGPAMAIALLIKEISKAEANDLVHVFVDNSNITIEGEYTVDSHYFNQLRIDYGRLITTVQCRHRQRSAPVTVREQGYEVVVFDQNLISHREKEVDIKLSMNALKTT
ncbi:8513_t:CDS:2, partial [Cetraspora pellucida]